jgi:hypothetical protein
MDPLFPSSFQARHRAPKACLQDGRRQTTVAARVIQISRLQARLPYRVATRRTCLGRPTLRLTRLRPRSAVRSTRAARTNRQPARRHDAAVMAVHRAGEPAGGARLLPLSTLPDRAGRRIQPVSGRDGLSRGRRVGTPRPPTCRRNADDVLGVTGRTRPPGLHGPERAGVSAVVIVLRGMRTQREQNYLRPQALPPPRSSTLRQQRRPRLSVGKRCS